jgi:hypothetical protein
LLKEKSLAIGGPFSNAKIGHNFNFNILEHKKDFFVDNQQNFVL